MNTVDVRIAYRALHKEFLAFKFDYPLHTVPESQGVRPLHYLRNWYSQSVVPQHRGSLLASVYRVVRHHCFGKISSNASAILLGCIHATGRLD